METQSEFELFTQNTLVIKEKKIEDNKVEEIKERTIESFKEKKFYLFWKRLFDIIISFFISIFLLPMFVIVAIIIKIDSKGPVFYKQERLGKNGKKFYLYKFRSMKIDAEKNGEQWASVNDERCTKIGKKLRLLHIDELPQIPFNILMGNISFIGPRPEREYFYNKFEEYIEGFSQRLLVKPGLTGLAQVSGGYDLKPEEKLVYDMEYIKKQSLLLDIKIFFKTFIVVIKRKGVR